MLSSSFSAIKFNRAVVETDAMKEVKEYEKEIVIFTSFTKRLERKRKV